MYIKLTAFNKTAHRCRVLYLQPLWRFFLLLAFRFVQTLATVFFFEVVARKFNKWRKFLWDHTIQGALLIWQETKNPGHIFPEYSCSKALVLIVAFCSLNSMFFKLILQLWLVCFLFVLKMHIWRKGTYFKETGDLTLGSW